LSSARIVVIGASAGGVRTLEDVVAGLPADFPAPLLVVLHISARRKSLLAKILAAAGPLQAVEASDGDRLAAGRIYVSVPDRHLLVGENGVIVSRGPKENNFRPSIDVLFRSAACHFGSRAIGVVLSGSLSDGSSGLFAIKQVGGLAVVQDPNEAPYPSMPNSAIARVDVDHTLPAKSIGPLLARLASEPPPEEPEGAAPYRRDLKVEIEVSASDSFFERGVMAYGDPSTYTCPACNGVLFRIEEAGADRFRCHTGHGFTSGALLDEYSHTVEDTLWEAVKGLQESIALLTEAAEKATAAGDDAVAESLGARARALKERLDSLRSITLEQGAFER
jgi:two-component system chemotaxis response regulator CheB